MPADIDGMFDDDMNGLFDDITLNK